MTRLRAMLTSKRAGEVFLVLLVAVAGYLLLVKGIRNFLVPSASMEPTLLIGDYLVTMRDRHYDRGDIVVVRDAAVGDYIVKRIVGVGGDSIRILDGALYVNDRYVSEPYLSEPMRYLLAEPFSVPEWHVFLLGDNRNNSEDSASEHRTFPVEDIVGRVRLIYYPYTRFGLVPRYPMSTLVYVGDQSGA